MATGSSTNFSIFNLFFSFFCIINPLLDIPFFWIAVIFWLFYAIIISAPSVQWLEEPLTWLPRQEGATDVEANLVAPK